MGVGGGADEAVTRASNLRRASRAAQLCFPYAIENSYDGSLEFGWIIVIDQRLSLCTEHKYSRNSRF